MPPITVPVGHKMVQNNVESYRKKKERDLKVEMNQRDLAGPQAMLLSRGRRVNRWEEHGEVSSSWKSEQTNTQRRTREKPETGLI